MATKIKGLQLWCRKMTEGYPHVDVSNFTTAWRNGMAFCAIIHRFRPDLIDYDSLSPENVFENNKLAFEVGESELSIPAFLEADDMARLKVPDKLSVITYVSQYYNYLNNLPQLGGPGVKGAVKKGSVAGNKRPMETTKVSSEPSNKKTVSAKEDAKNVANTNTTTASSPRKGTVGDKCGICNNKVYLLERHMDGGKLYHRSCYRHSDLSPTNKVLSKSPFMSPSLNNEKAMAVDRPASKGYGVKDTSQTPVNDSHGKYTTNNSDVSSKKEKGNETSSVLASLKSGLKKLEGSSSSGGVVGSKHSIQSERDKDDEAKKAKVQPRNLFGVGVGGGGGGGTGKENMNNTASEKKVADEPAFPLSGKEAKKLEKRRQEILASESSTPGNKGAKRGMPLIFQSKDKSEPSSSSVSSSSSSSSSTPSTNKLSSGSTSAASGIDTKPSSKTQDLKSKDTGANKLNAIQSLQHKFSGQSQPLPSKIETTTSTPTLNTGSNCATTTSNSNQPVARPRVAGTKIASSPFLDNDSNSLGKKGNGLSLAGSGTEPVGTRNKKDLKTDTGPVAAPRKSVNLSHTPHLSAESSSSEDNSTPRSAYSKSSTASSSAASTPPPALPLTPPPSLPQSKPPPLPSTAPPAAAISTNHQSSLAKNKPTPSSLSSSSSSSSDTTSTKLWNHSAGKDRKDLSTPHLHHSSSSTSSPSTTATTTAKISLKPVSPTPTHPQPSTPTTLVNSTEKKDNGNVLTGLLASLAGVRGRSASTPNTLITIQQNQQPATTTSKDNTTTKTAPKSTIKLSSVTSMSNATATPSTPSLTVTSNLSNRKHSEPAIKTGDVNIKLSVLSSDKYAHKNTNNGSPSSPSAIKKIIPNSKSDSKEAVNILSSLKPVSTTNNVTIPKDNASNTSSSSNNSGTSHSSGAVSNRKLDSLIDSTKSKNTKNENKVGSLVKTYLSNSKDDLASAGLHSKEATHSKSEDVFKKPSKPSRVKDTNNKDQPNKGNNALWRREELTTQIGDGQSKHKDTGATVTTTPMYDVKLKKVGLPMELGQDFNNSKKQTEEEEDKKQKETKSTSDSDMPQWKKDIEERKKKLREDIARSEAPSKRGDKEIQITQSGKDSTSKQKTSEKAPDRSDLPAKSEKVTSPRGGAEASSKEFDSKLNWQKEAERRMAAFALFDSEEERKSRDSDVKIEGKIMDMNNDQKKRNAESKMNKLKESNEFTKINNKSGLKTVDIDIDVSSDKGRKGLSVPLSINSSNNNNSTPSRVDEISRKTIAEPGKLSVDKGKDAAKQASPKSSPKLKRKITVLGPNNQKTNNQHPAVSPPVTPAVQEKKKIAVTSKFDFDSNSAVSDFESSLSQMSIEDQRTSTPSSPQRPPRTRSQRNKAASPKQISAIELQQQLMEIDNRLTDLELRGRDLEDSIRNASFQEGSSEATSSLSNSTDDLDDFEDDDRLMMEWFQLVSEKNDLVRQEADLVYLSREQDLEDEQEQLDHQLRYLISKDELTKSPQEKEEESYLLQRKVDIVNQRSSIIDSMDEDRLRYEEEDRGIEYVLKSKGLWKDDDGSFLAEQGRSVANSTFYA